MPAVVRRTSYVEGPRRAADGSILGLPDANVKAQVGRASLLGGRAPCARIAAVMQTTTVRPAQDKPLPHLVRPMGLGDISQVMEGEQQSFPTMWPPTAFRREIEQNRLARYLVAVERREAPPPAEGEAPPEARPAGVGRFLGGLRPILESADAAPPEERRELVVGFIGVWLLADQTHILTLAVPHR